MGICYYKFHTGQDVSLISNNDRFQYPSVNNLCRIAEASERTLRYAFDEQFRISPKVFLQAYRLNKVYRTLQQSKTGRFKIADIANAWGFWHMGQFAKDYKLSFGELPSETLKLIP